MTSIATFPSFAPPSEPPQMANLPLAQIIEGERRRIDYGPIDDLRESILTHGLIHPIAVAITDDPARYLLIAGGRRFQAYTSLGLPTIPARIYSKPLTELELRILELEENIQRLDMSWDERIHLQKEIHDTKIAMHGPKVSTSPDAPGHTIADTARILNKGTAIVAQDLRLAKAMAEFPDFDWKSCKNKSEAFKLMNSVERLLVNNVGADDFQRRISTIADDVSERRERILGEAYQLGDCLARIPLLPDGLFTFVEIDPPYAVDLCSQKTDTSDGKLFDYNEISSDTYIPFLRELLQKVVPKMADNSWLIIWHAFDLWYSEIFNLLKEVGLAPETCPAIWVKFSSGGQNNRPESQLTRSYETFIYARKGDIRLNRPGRVNNFTSKPTPAHRKIHPTERPVHLIREILRTFVPAGGHVLVPFAGSGASLKAAYDEAHSCVGFDLGKSFRDAYLVSLSEEVEETPDDLPL